MKAFAVFAVFFLTSSVSTTSKHREDPLILTPYLERGEEDKARSLAAVDPDMFLGYESYSGFLTVQKQYNNNLFFWYFPGTSYQADMAPEPLIVWLQGGPGCTSLKGLFDLIGPFAVKNGELKEREISWSSKQSLLFVDNPVGAGFSFSGKGDRGCPDNEDDVGDQLYNLLRQFFSMFPALKASPLYISGQSYAGKYVPALAIQIHRRQRLEKINLKGITIGNGLIDMRSIIQHYHELCFYLGILEDTEIEKLKAIENKVVQDIDKEDMVAASNGFNATIEFIKKHSGISIFNFLNDPGNNSKPPEYEIFLQRADVRKAIHVGKTPFHLNNQRVYQKMLPDIANTTKPFIEELLEHYAVLCYAGQEDVILAHGLLKHTYNSFRWPKREEYIKAQRQMIRTPDDSKLAAYIKKGGSFYEVVVRNAGHDVPADQPALARWLIDMFVHETRNN